jgi:hypothetical protein
MRKVCAARQKQAEFGAVKFTLNGFCDGGAQHRSRGKAVICVVMRTTSHFIVRHGWPAPILYQNA